MEYSVTAIPEFIAVRSIVTVYRLTLTDRPPRGEAHDFPELIYTAQGGFSVFVDGERFALREGQLLIYAPGAYHIGTGERRPESGTDVEIVSFRAESDMLPRLYNRVITLNAAQRSMMTNLVTAGLPCFERTAPGSGLMGLRRREGVSDCALQKLSNQLELLLIDIWQADQEQENGARAANAANREREQWEAVEAYLRAHIGESLTLEEIAAAVHLSVSTLSAIARRQCGCGVIARFNGMKVDGAMRLIRETSMNFTQIADTLGFPSIHYFSRLFKKIAGVTPTEYAKRDGGIRKRGGTF